LLDNLNNQIDDRNKEIRFTYLQRSRVAGSLEILLVSTSSSSALLNSVLSR